MSFTLGRFESTRDIKVMSHNGDRLSITFDILPSTVAEAKVRRQQVLGLVGNDDERFVPLTSSEDSDLDGFYRVESVQVDPVDVYLVNGLMRCQASLTRVAGGYANPLHEVYALCADASSVTLTGGGGTTFGDDADYAFVAPSTHIAENATATTPARASSDSATLLRYFIDNVTAGAAQFGLRQIVPPDEHYTASCSVDLSVGGTWYPAVGLQIPDGSTVRAASTVARFYVESDGELVVESWDGAAWREKRYTVTFSSGTETVDELVEVRILRNGPDRVAVRYTCRATDDAVHHVTATIRRGEPLVEVSLATSTATTWKVTRSTTEAATVIQDDNNDSVGVHATSNDANGDRFVLVARSVITEDSTNGGITFAVTSPPAAGSSTGGVDAGFQALEAVTFGVGLEIDGTSAVDPNDATTLAASFMGAVYTTRSLVG